MCTEENLALAGTSLNFWSLTQQTNYYYFYYYHNYLNNSINFSSILTYYGAESATKWPITVIIIITNNYDKNNIILCLIH
jgi:hypothetical protein